MSRLSAQTTAKPDKGRRVFENIYWGDKSGNLMLDLDKEMEKEKIPSWYSRSEYALEKAKFLFKTKHLIEDFGDTIFDKLDD